MKPLFALIACVATAACIPTKEPISGQAAFLESCAGCHGNDARGAGEVGLTLDKVPPDLTGLAARNGGVFPRDAVMSTIDGLTRRPHFSADMPEFGAGDMGDTIIVENPDGTGTPVPERLLALADYLESLQR
jgi:mono/diheme cytochrome c family protein